MARAFYTNEEKTKHITMWKESGLNRKEYAANNGINEGTFYKWLEGFWTEAYSCSAISHGNFLKHYGGTKPGSGLRRKNLSARHGRGRTPGKKLRKYPRKTSTFFSKESASGGHTESNLHNKKAGGRKTITYNGTYPCE